MVDESPALAAHAAWPTGTVHRLLRDDPEPVEVDISPVERKRAYHARRAQQIKEFAIERGISQAAARVQIRRQK